MTKKYRFAALLSLICACSLTSCEDKTQEPTTPGEPTQPGDPTQPGNPTQPSEPKPDSLILISPSTGLMTTEDGEQATFQISLKQQPTADVHITLTGYPNTEGSLDITELVFTPQNYQIPQTVTVKGVNDNIPEDGNRIFYIDIRVNSADNAYEGYNLPSIEVVNVDTTIPIGYDRINTVNYLYDTDGMHTDEFGTRAYVVFSMANRPAYDVKVTLKSTDPSEGIPERTSFTITPDTFNDLIEIPVTGVDDNEVDGKQNYKIIITDIQTKDPSIKKTPYNFGDDVYGNEIECINDDNDGEPLNELIITKVTKTSAPELRNLNITGTVSEDGSCIEYSARLKEAPKNGSTVFVTGVCTDPTEGSVDPVTVTFNSKDYNQLKTFKICGIDDEEIDGDVAFRIKFISFSDDLASDDLASEDIIILNKDNDGQLKDELAAAVVITAPYSELYTNEDGQSKTFHVTLNRQPQSDVFVTITTSDPTEGLVLSNTSLTGSTQAKSVKLRFTPLDWNAKQYVNVVGQNDYEADGIINYQLNIATESEDAPFNALTTEPIYCRNFDNDNEPLPAPQTDEDLSPNQELISISGVDSENPNIIGETPRTIWVSLTTKPSDEVRVTFSEQTCALSTLSTDATPDRKCSQTLKFSPNDYRTPKALNVHTSNKITHGDVFNIKLKDSVSDTDDRFNNIKRMYIPFTYYKDATYIPTETDQPRVDAHDVKADLPKLVFSPDVCNSIGTVDADQPQRYTFHLASQPKNNVKVTFDIPDQYSDLIKFKNNKFNFTFKPSNYDVDQTLEIEAKSQPSNQTLTALDYTMTSADNNYNGSDPNKCEIKLYALPDQASQPQGNRTAKLRIMAANATSGSDQLYEAPGMNMLYAMDPDIIIIQEFAGSAEEVVQNLEEHFHTKYSYHKGKGRIGNGIIVKGENKIKNTYTHPSIISTLRDRYYEAAIVDIPGDKDLLVVSLHLYTKASEDQVSQIDEYPDVAKFIHSILNEGDYYVAVGGDFNSSTNYYVNYYWNSMLATDITYPRDQNGNFKTNASRRRHYDWILVDKKFQEFSVPTQIGSQTFPNGYVLDSRVHSPLSEISPVEYDDSDAPNMQHMPVIRDFMIAY